MFLGINNIFYAAYNSNNFICVLADWFGISYFSCFFAGAFGAGNCPVNNTYNSLINLNNA